MISNKLWDFLKWVAIAGLHFIGVAYGQLANIWGLPYGQSITETLDIVGALLGVFLMWENHQYKQNFEVFTAPKVQPVEDASPILPDTIYADVKAEDVE